MIKRDKHLITLDQTIAYKNTDLQFVDFTDNLLPFAGLKKENELLGKKDDEGLPWSVHADEYHQHDKDALAGKQYAAIVPFTGEKMHSSLPVLCTRSRCLLEDNKSIGVFIHVMPVSNPSLIQLTYTLQKQDPSGLNFSYYLGRNPTDIRLTAKENECLFYLIRGKSATLISKFMRISSRTVEFHINNLKMKFKCSNKSELISCAIQNGYMSMIPEHLSFATLHKRLQDS
jgi:DNA-binding CsgD family transcriptional regulator